MSIELFGVLLLVVGVILFAVALSVIKGWIHSNRFTIFGEELDDDVNKLTGGVMLLVASVSIAMSFLLIF